MPLYHVYYTRETRYHTPIEADGPQEAIEAFWRDENTVCEFLSVHDGSVGPPVHLALTDIHGNPIVWGERTDLS